MIALTIALAVLVGISLGLLGGGGSILTGLGLGVIEGFTRVFYPEASATVVFLIMAIVLLLRPAGLLVATSAYVPGAAAVLGGDMNVTPRGDAFHPDQLDPLYRWYGTGPFVEVEGTRALCDPVQPPCGPTLGTVKFDYVFLDRASWSTPSATTASALVSDHRLLKGNAWR